MDKGEYIGESKIKWEFIGEPPKDKSYTLRVSNIQRKDNPSIGGTIKVHTSFIVSSPSPATSPATRVIHQNTSSPSGGRTNVTTDKRYSRRPEEAAKRLHGQGSFQINRAPGSSPGISLAAGTRVQFSANGR